MLVDREVEEARHAGPETLGRVRFLGTMPVAVLAPTGVAVAQLLPEAKRRIVLIRNAVFERNATKQMYESCMVDLLSTIERNTVFRNNPIVCKHKVCRKLSFRRYLALGMLFSLLAVSSLTSSSPGLDRSWPRRAAEAPQQVQTEAEPPQVARMR